VVAAMGKAAGIDVPATVKIGQSERLETQSTVKR
jgi:hypothetical protein